MHKGRSFACLANLYVSCLMGLNRGKTQPYLHLSSCFASRSHRPPASRGFQERSGLGTNDRVRHFVKAISTQKAPSFLIGFNYWYWFSTANFKVNKQDLVLEKEQSVTETFVSDKLGQDGQCRHETTFFRTLLPVM